MNGRRTTNVGSGAISRRRYVYVWADAVYLQTRMESHAECMLVLIGAHT